MAWKALNKSMKFFDFVFLLATCFRFAFAQNGKFILDSAVLKCEKWDTMSSGSDSGVKNYFLSNESAEDVIDLITNEIKNSRTCTKHVLGVTIKIVTEAGQSNSKGTEGSLIQVEKVIDESGRKVILGQPYAINIQQLPTYKVHILKYLTTINAQAKEDVFNSENTPDFKGCEEPVHPVCQSGKRGGKEFTTKGFCCSCSPGSSDTGGRQFRGGQLCRAGNPNTTSTSSIHCFRISKFWYAVHELGPAQILQEVTLQVFKKVDNEGGYSWDKIGDTKEAISLDSIVDLKYNHPELSAALRPSNVTAAYGNINHQKHRLLIPKLSPDSKAHKGFPDAMVGPVDESYLIVSTDLLDPTGRKCDKAGVKHKTFAVQADACRQPRGSCLKNQPLDLWASDGASPVQNFKLKQFGKINLEAPIKIIDKDIFLTFTPDSTTTAFVDISIPIDDLVIVKPGYGAAILRAVSDSSSNAARLTIEVGNKELVPSYFAIHVLHCSEPSLSSQKHTTDLDLISARGTINFVLDIHHPNNKRLRRGTTCVVAVVNDENKIVALRDVLLSPGDSCICRLNCGCVCTLDSITCTLISREKALAAGLDFNSFPEIVSLGDPSDSKETDKENFLGDLVGKENRVLLYVCVGILVITILLFLGLLKALIGLCWKQEGLFGLGYFHNSPKTLTKYYEKNISKMGVIYNNDGFPLDPFTKLPTVQRLSNKEMFLLNVAIFVISPWLILEWVTRSCRPWDSKMGSSKSNVSIGGRRNSFKSLHEGSTPSATSKTTTNPDGAATSAQSASGHLGTTNTASMKSRRLSSIRPSDSSVEYNYRKTQG